MEKKLESAAVHVDKLENGMTVAFVRGVIKCHSPIINEITRLIIEANYIILAVHLFTLSVVFCYYNCICKFQRATC